jgi:hypothetical protein
MLDSRGEVKIHEILEEAGLTFKEEFSFEGLASENGRPLRFDFVIFDDDGTTITVDSALSTTSENPVQNKVITVEVNTKQPKTLATPLTLGGVQYTTVESFLGAVKNIVQATSYWNGGA